MNILQIIKKHLHSLSNSQKSIAQYILSNYKKAAFLNSIELAQVTGVSNPTVIRFATALGYTGYPQFQAALQNMIQNELSSLERLNYLKPAIDDSNLTGIYQLEINNIEQIYKNLDADKIMQASNLLYQSDRIFIVGEQISDSIADFAAYSLNKICAEVYRLKHWDLNINKMLNENEKTASSALIIALPRYPNKTLQYIRRLREQEIPMIIITDSAAFPNIFDADVLLFAPIRYISFIDPISAIICLINSILIEITRLDQSKAEKYLSKFEEYVDRCYIYNKDTIPL